ncbi:MAG TPA: Mpo1-like protein [Brumimicrobium sp.]|nr:Mpo1-like protein [Brumimicrobium sp.]
MGEKKIVKLLREYSESHENRTNKLIHWLCVPLIFFSIFGLIRTMPVPDFMSNTSSYFNWMNIVLLLVLLYYISLSIPLFFAFIFWALFVSFGNEYLFINIGSIGLLIFSISVFILAWIGQFVGHSIEGKKPSFLKDLQFLLIGPAWLMNFIFKSIKY